MPGFALITELRMIKTNDKDPETSNRKKRGFVYYAKYFVVSSIELKIINKNDLGSKVLEVLFKCFNNNIPVLYRNLTFSVRHLIHKVITAELFNRNVIIVEDNNICLKSTETK